jgi:hypothetical protein
MITLPTEFKSGVGGFSTEPLTYTQLHREGNVAVFQRTNANGKVKDYEVILIKVIPKGTSIFNAPPSLDDEERYSSTGQWGTTGFSYCNKLAAINKMKELLGDIKEKVVEVDTTNVKFFTIKQYAEENSIDYAKSVKIINEAVKVGKFKFLGEKRMNPKGKASRIFCISN